MPPLPDLMAELVDRARRGQVLARLARHHGAAGLLVLVPDPETGRPLPAPGLPSTLPGSVRWRALLRACRTPGEREATVEAPEGGADLRVLAWTGPEGDTLLFLDPGPGCRPAEVAPLFRLVCTLFRAELTADLAKTQAAVARDATEQSGHLLQALEAARHQIARKAVDLSEALASAERANAALQVANASLDAERLAAERAAGTDLLTGVASRAGFESDLALAVARATATADPLALLLIDLDGFKEINDTRGHAAGDATLAAVGAALRATAGGDCIAGRLGGDEFALILPDCRAEDAAATAGRLQSLIGAAVPFGGGEIAVRSTVGLACFPDDAASARDLLRKADLGLYDAKRRNKGALGRYRAGLESLFDARQRDIATLRRALDGNRVVAHYQPKVALADRRLVGFEALARLIAEDGALLGPAAFWSALSDQESARLLGVRMLDLVLGDLVACRAAGLPQHPVAINVSGGEISCPGFADAVLDKLRRSGVDARVIEVEITEMALLGDHPTKVRAALGTLRAAGVSVALDDFGTGYSSLSYLLDWDVDRIKIDKSFVGDFDHSARSTRIVRSIVDLARSLEITAVAEGVETARQADYLCAIGCPQAQGYFFGRAVPPEVALGCRGQGAEGAWRAEALLGAA